MNAWFVTAIAIALVVVLFWIAGELDHWRDRRRMARRVQSGVLEEGRRRRRRPLW